MASQWGLQGWSLDKYAIDIRVSSGATKAEAKLVILLTGIYDLEVGTATGALSMNAVRGKPSNASLYVRNTGTTISAVTFQASPPKDWQVVFDPPGIEAIEPGELKQVEISITPSEPTQVGDYSVHLGVESHRVSKSLDYRVTVRAASQWGWIGICLIVMIVLGIMGTFRWMGRRG